ncbi:MAG: sigma-70 family RNA polymerase sigma factor [Salinisphaera sp.]|nr:sigma-70 family RNA polymerase sigma factor [Salinisphaera sp.]
MERSPSARDPDHSAGFPGLVTEDREQLAAWLRDTAAGDDRAFRSLYQATAPKLYALLLRILHSQGEAEDALQDVFVSVWQNAASYKRWRGTPLTWLLTIARNRAFDLLRRRRPETGLDDLGPNSESALAGRASLQPERQNEVMQALENVQRFLKELPRDQRRALTLAYFQGMPYHELARRLGVPENTVKTWVRRGLIHLRALLTERSGGDT